MCKLTSPHWYNVCLFSPGLVWFVAISLQILPVSVHTRLLLLLIQIYELSVMSGGIIYSSCTKFVNRWQTHINIIYTRSFAYSGYRQLRYATLKCILNLPFACWFKLYILVQSFGVEDNAIAQSVKICTVIVILALVMYTTKGIHYTSASVNKLGWIL